jgi:HK97 family phage major capsid protein
LLGRPVIPCEACSAPGTVGDVILVDLNEYLVADKPSLFLSSSHYKFLTGEVALRITYRVAGQPIWSKAVTPKNGTNTISPVVTLAAR